MFRIRDNSFISLALVYLLPLAFFGSDFRDINLPLTDADYARPLIGPLQGCDIAMLLGFGWLSMQTELVARWLRNSTVRLYAVLVLALAMLGLFLRTSDMVFWNNDVRIWGMFPVGIIWSALLLQTARPALHMGIVGIGLTSFMCMALYLNPGAAQIDVALSGVSRLVNLSVYNTSSLLYSFAGILLIISISRRKWILLSGATAIIMAQLLVATISATRSATISIGIFLLAASVTLLRLNPKPGKKYDWASISKLGGVLAALSLLLLPFSTEILAFGQLLLERILGQTVESTQNISGRSEEVGALLSWLDATGYMFGHGFGARFPSPIYGDFWPDLHIGFFTFLLKGGMGLLCFVGFILILYLPWKYIKVIWKVPGQRSPREWAALGVVPGVAGSSSILFMSGGYSTYVFFGWGLMFGLTMLATESDLAKLSVRPVGLSDGRGRSHAYPHVRQPWSRNMPRRGS